MSTSRRELLLVEDSPGDARLIRELLGESTTPTFVIHHVDRLAAGLAQLAARSFDAVLLDLSLPDSQGVETFARMRACAPHTPIVVMTSQDDEALAIQALQQGVQDYLVKGSVDCPGLVRSIRYAIERQRVEEERERLLAQVAAERNWLRAVIDRCPVGIILIEGSDGQRIVANRWAEDVFGRAFTPALGVGQHLGRVCRPSGEPLLIDELPGTRALRGEVITGEEVLLRQPDGGELPVLTSAGPIRNAGGAIVGAVIVFDDATAMKELERLREEWTSVVAHDLRQPVAVINTCAQLLARQVGRDNQRMASVVEHLRTSARRLDRMIGDLSEHSQIEARQLALMRQLVDVPALVNAVVERVGAIAGERPVRVAIEGSIPRVNADPERLEQVLGNLLSNAVKYGYPGTEILVTAERRGQEIRVAVMNQGEGIPPDEQPKLFARFQRLERVPESTPGLGLGLYVCRGLVEAHGGRIWVESLPEQTTTFYFTVPVVAAGT